MELVLTHTTPSEIRVMCDQHYSHSFLLWEIPYPDEQVLFHDSIVYGRTLYQELFPPDTKARHALLQYPKQIVLVAEQNDLDAIPWEYLFGALREEEQAPENFLVAEIPFVRGLPAAQRIAPPAVEHLHIVAIPSDPLSENVARLDVEAEWERLKESVASVPFALTLERTAPPTLAQLRNALAGHPQRVVHFMGHGQQGEHGALLCFEQENGDLDTIEAHQFVECIQASAFLVTLNACVSAASGKTVFSNLASALIHQHIPYALGMRFRIRDNDARTFSHTFYKQLASGTSIEAALCQARQALLQARLVTEGEPELGSIGVPVLYTSLVRSAAGFVCKEGKPIIQEHRPPMESSVLLCAERGFQGRIADLKHLGIYLTGNNRPAILTIHGAGGQGKTVLAREAVERFAWAWPSGVWAISLEHLPDRATVVYDLARFLGINTQEMGDPEEVEHQVLSLLTTRRILLVLDNAETLVDALTEQNVVAIELAQWLQRLSNRSTHLLVTSRMPLRWAEEVVLELGGLSPEEGAKLFRQYAPQRSHVIDQATVQKLGEQVGGHPLSLRLLGGAFNFSTLSLAAFLAEATEHLRQSEDKEQKVNNRQRPRDKYIEIGIRYLDKDLRNLLQGLCIFHAPFLPEIAVAIFDPDTPETEDQPSSVRTCLHRLWERSLLEIREIANRDERIQLYMLLPATRLFVEQMLESTYEYNELMRRFGIAFTALVSEIFQRFEREANAVVLAQQCDVDLERGWVSTTGLAQGKYLRQWGRIVFLLGNPQRSLPLLERALEVFQTEGDFAGEANVLNSIGLIYERTGKSQRALEFYEQALAIMREINDHAGKAATLTNIGIIYQRVGQSQRALEIYEQALSIEREVEDLSMEAATLNAMALVYEGIGQPQKALSLYEQALLIRRKTSHRPGEAAILHNMGLVCEQTGQPQKALSLYEQALSIMREVGDRAGQAIILNSMGLVYEQTGQPQKALSLYEQALSIMREVGDRTGQAITLNNIAGAYQGIGQLQRAQEVYEQALSITQEVGNRSSEARLLNNMAVIYDRTGQPQKALSLYEQALSIRKEVGDRAGQATTLHNMGLMYEQIGQSQKALSLYEQALPIIQGVGNRLGEAVILNSLAVAYEGIGQSQKALETYEQALPITQEVSNRAGQAATLNNMAGIYERIGQPQKALETYEQGLPIAREIGDRSGEAAILNNMAGIYGGIGQHQQALALYEQALPIRREVDDSPGEATTLGNIAILRYYYLNSPSEAATYLEEAIALLQTLGLPQDSAGRTVKQLQEMLESMTHSFSPGTQTPPTLPDKLIQQIVRNTIAVMTVVSEQQLEWSEQIIAGRQNVQQRGATWQIEVDFFTALLDLLAGRDPTLSANHPYTPAIDAIQQGIATWRGQYPSGENI